MNRVTDTCIPEMEAMRRIENEVLKEWVRADKAGERFFPHQFMYKILLSGDLKKSYQIDPKNSWLLAAAEKNLPMFVPGWEDATLGNMYAGHCISGDVKKVHTVRTGIEYMMELAEWYTETTKTTPLGFFQIGGGIAGDFPICVVPDAAPGSAARARPVVGVLLPDFRFNHQLRLLLRRRAQRKDHVGQAGREDAEVHRRIRRLNRRAADVCIRAGLVTAQSSVVSHLLSVSDISSQSTGSQVHGICEPVRLIDVCPMISDELRQGWWRFHSFRPVPARPGLRGPSAIAGLQPRMAWAFYQRHKTCPP